MWFEEVRSNPDRRGMVAKKFQTHQFPFRLCLVTNDDTYYVMPLDTVRNKHFRLFVGWQGSEMLWSAPEWVTSFDDLGEQLFESIGSATYQPAMSSRRIARTKFRTGMPKVVRSDQQYDPILE